MFDTKYLLMENFKPSLIKVKYSGDWFHLSVEKSPSGVEDTSGTLNGLVAATISAEAALFWL